MSLYIIKASRNQRTLREDVFESPSMETALACAKDVWAYLGDVSWLALQGRDYPGMVARITLKPEEKLALYKAGKYVFRPPDVCHALWDDAAWIAWIDACNGWRQ